MKPYPRIEDIPPEIRAFFEEKGKLKLDDEETPTMCFVKPYDGSYGWSVAITVAELRWIDYATRDFARLWEDSALDPHDWLYLVPGNWLPEKEMLRAIKLRAFF